MSTKTLEELWFDRDLGWLEFNRRVLAEAQDERTPLLERLTFLGIFTSNLDEFFMKRIATLRLQSNGSHARLMEDLRRVIVPLIGQQRACLASLMPALEAHGVRILGCNDLTERQRLEASRFFEQNVSPALTPQVVDAAHPIPFLSNLSFVLGLSPPRTRRRRRSLRARQGRHWSATLASDSGRSAGRQPLVRQRHRAYPPTSGSRLGLHVRRSRRVSRRDVIGALRRRGGSFGPRRAPSDSQRWAVTEGGLGSSQISASIGRIGRGPRRRRKIVDAESGGFRRRPEPIAHM